MIQHVLNWRRGDGFFASLIIRSNKYNRDVFWRNTMTTEKVEVIEVPEVIEKKPETQGLVVYIKDGSFEHKKRSHYYSGMHGYFYSNNKEGKKKLAKNVPTKNGYYTSNPQLDDGVVSIEQYLSGYTVAYKNAVDNTIALLEGLLSTIEPVPVSSLYLIIDSPFIVNFLIRPLKDIEKNLKLGKTEITAEQFTQVVAFRERLIELETKYAITINANAAAEGGLGNRTVNKQTKLAEAFTRSTSKPTHLFNLLTKKSFEAPEVDFNRIVCGNRWYINTGKDTTHYHEVEGYRYYSFGTVEPKKKYYGKLTPDVTFSRLYTKSPMVVLDKLFDYVQAQIPNKEGYLSAGNLDLVKSKDLTFLIDTIPGIPQGNNLIMPHRVGAVDEPVLVELINPPMMSYVIKERLTVLDNALSLFLHPEKRPDNLTYIDITDKIYDKVANKKGDIKVSLVKDLTTVTDFIKIDVTHRNAKKPVPITVSFRYDLPERNGLNSVDHPDVAVWVVADTRLHKGIMFYTIVATPDWVYINTNAVGNLRILSEKELK